MVTYKRAFFAVLVTAIVTGKLADIGLKDLLSKKDAFYKEAADTAFLAGFDAGRAATLDDRYLISRTYMRHALNMEMN